MVFSITGTENQERLSKMASSANIRAVRMKAFDFYKNLELFFEMAQN